MKIEVKKKEFQNFNTIIFDIFLFPHSLSFMCMHLIYQKLVHWGHADSLPIINREPGKGTDGATGAATEPAHTLTWPKLMLTE